MFFASHLESISLLRFLKLEQHATLIYATIVDQTS